MPFPKLGQAIVAGAIVLALLGSQSSAGTVTGTATYRERIALPPDATLFVELQDISRADAAAVTLAAQRYALNGVPSEFELTFDDALIREGMTYAVRGSIYRGGELLFTTDTVHPVLTNGEGNSADLVLVQAGAQSPATLEGTEWTAIGIGGTVLDTKRPPQLSFAQGGAFGGTGGCNRFSGQAEITGNSLEFPDNMAATLMACPPELDEVEDQFFAALQNVTSYAVAGDSMVLLDAAGEPILKFVRTQ
ncbi:YbaY family lipoprotein [Ruegeria sp. SCSIO 43209]|uniref:YbaY family lipoprotein n=1 Tax=Ruegeria sp. SCSIO 43209 TaxID=2793010 RepID=UPI00147FB835|nr:YbaY family lipoprotein [Ruegeria sp. SCSIO 43209]UAB87664.1 YbaY family lipoprotein [Ruegeria sp. SCSIO 43209]